MADITREQVVEFLSGLNIIEISELVSELEEKWGVSAAAPVAVAAAGAGGGDAAAAEQTEFDVILTDFGGQKIKVIKAVREITGLGLKDAKGLVEGVPKAVKEATTKEDAESIVAKLEEAGAKAEIK